MRVLKKFFRIIFCLSVFIPIVAQATVGQSSLAGSGCPMVVDLYPEKDNSMCLWCTQIYFTDTEEILVSSRNNFILHRKKGEGRFRADFLPLLHPHSIIFNPFDKHFYVSDTDNNRILVLTSLEQPSVLREINEIAAIKLSRPHDIVIDPVTGWIYTINPSSAIIFKFRRSGEHEGCLDLSSVLGYSRALSLVDGKIYVAGSSYGRVVEIQDFDSGTYKVYQSAGKKAINTQGTWQTTGLIINDIERFQGYWYATSYFTADVSETSLDSNKNKFIRFRNWQELEDGTWQDISNSLPDGLVPYFLTAHNDGLYVALFNNESPGQNESVYRVLQQCISLPFALPLLLQ